MALGYFGYPYYQVIFRAPAGEGMGKGKGSPRLKKKMTTKLSSRLFI